MKLYRGFTTQEEIDREYNPTLAVADANQRIEGWVARSARARAKLRCSLGVKYGPTRDEHLDIFPAGDGAPVHVFVHGGYWRRFSAREHSFVAPALVEAGLAVLVVNYALCPAVTIDEIVRQVRAAIAWAHANAKSFGGDRERITVSGHSAGGHLTAMALSTDWPGWYDLPADTVKGGVAISGLFDLAPFPFSYLQPALQLDWAQVHRNSPIRHVPAAGPPLVAAVGGAESAEFRRQSRDYAQARPGARYLEVAGADHFTVVEELERPGSELFGAVLALGRG
jgi:arylformamidase